MNVKYTRDRFNADRGVICVKDFLFSGIELKFGDIFHIDNPRTSTRARQLYEMRKLEHLDSFIKQYGESKIGVTTKKLVKKSEGLDNSLEVEEAEEVEEIEDLDSSLEVEDSKVSEDFEESNESDKKINSNTKRSK